MPMMTYLAEKKTLNITEWEGYVIIALIIICAITISIVLWRTKNW